MYGRAILAIVCLVPAVCFATDYGGGKPGASNATAVAGAIASGGSGGAGGTGGTGGVGTGNVSQEAKSYGLGMAGLAASANACQGSVSIAVVGFTYTVEFCRTLQEVTMMGSLGFSKESLLNRVCQLDSIAATASECTGRKIQK